MYLVLLILRELRRLFNNKTFKLGFTIAILTFAILNLIALLPSSGVFASTRIDCVMSHTMGYIGQTGSREQLDDIYTGYGSYDTMDSIWENVRSGYDQFFYSSYVLKSGSAQSPTISYNQCNVYYFPVSADKMYTIGNGYTGSGNVILFYTETAPVEGVGCVYLKNMTGAGNYFQVSPGYGYFVIIIYDNYSYINNPFIAYYSYDGEIGETDIQTSTNTTTNTIIKSSEKTQNTIVQESQETQNTIVQESQETRNTITDTNIDNTITDILPQDTFVNPYESNVDSIFTKIYNAFTTYSTQTPEFTIPFTNKTIRLSLTNMYGSFDGLWLPSALKSLISMFWYYLFGRFIIIDVLGIIEKIKNGKIDKIVDSNVKEDML